MTDERLGILLPRIQRALGLDDPDIDTLTLLEDELRDAEGELCLYLGVSELEEALLPKVTALAAVFYRRDRSLHGDVKSVSYTEGQLSQSETYLSAADYRSAVAEIEGELARYRRVTCG